MDPEISEDIKKSLVSRLTVSTDFLKEKKKKKMKAKPQDWLPRGCSSPNWGSWVE